jgi:hypothetical protein
MYIYIYIYIYAIRCLRQKPTELAGGVAATEPKVEEANAKISSMCSTAERIRQVRKEARFPSK